MVTPDQISDLARAVPEVARLAYIDAAAPGLKQAGKIGEDLLKTLRLILFPLQYAAVLQDRLEGYIDQAIRQVPHERLIAPIDSILLPIAERLRFQEGENPITEMYINLLARAMDGERVGEAHPAFISVISQLAPDEVVLLREISRREYTAIIQIDQRWEPLSRGDIENALKAFQLQTGHLDRLREIVFQFDILNQPEMFRVFDEHLRHLGLTTYINEPSNNGEFKGVRFWIPEFPRLFFQRTTSFGLLFHKACMSGGLSKEEPTQSPGIVSAPS